MKIFYDPKADAVDIVFKKGKVFKTREIGREMYLDLDKKGEPLSLEIIGVSERFSVEDLKYLTFNIANYPKGFGRAKLPTSQ